MNWKLKSKIQNAVAALPSSISYSIYYWIQRHFGGLRHVNPIIGLSSGIEACKKIEKTGRSVAGSTVLEVGTGRRINIPLAFWINGADKIITVDLNPYLMAELIREDIAYIRANRDKIEALFDCKNCNDRLRALIFFTNKHDSINDILDFCNIRYITHVDAAQLPLESSSIDFHTSNNVLEHIPPNSLSEILAEGIRVLKKNGVFIHRIDYSDHFSHSDNKISAINFLKYSEADWAKYAKNRYMYMNRLRHDDFIKIIHNIGARSVLEEPIINQDCINMLRNGDLRLDERFKDKTVETNSTTSSWIVAEKIS